MPNVEDFLTPGTTADVVATATQSPGDVSQQAYSAEYNALGIKTNLVVPLTQVASGNNAGIKSVVGTSDIQTTQTPISSTGNVTSSNVIGYNDGTGWWMGFDNDGIPKFFLGNSAGNKMTWDGTTLTIVGTLTASSINIPDAVSANSFHVDVNGNAWWGSTTIAGATAVIPNTGLATFQGMTSLNMRAYTDFEGSGRFIQTDKAGSGSAVFGNQGVTVAPGITATSFMSMHWWVVSNIFLNNPFLCVSMQCLGGFASSDGVGFFGLGTPNMSGSGMSETGRPLVGWEFKKVSGTTTATAIQCDGTSNLAYQNNIFTVTDGDSLELYIKMTASGTNFYYRKNNGALTLGATLVNYAPTSGDTYISFASSNKGTTTDFQFQFQCAAYEH